MNSANEGITNQNILIDNPYIFSVSFVSIYNHVNASTDTIGIEASIHLITNFAQKRNQLLHLYININYTYSCLLLYYAYIIK